MSDSARDLLVRGITAAKAKDHDQARFYLEWVLRSDSDRQQKIKAWLWLSQISDDPAEKRDCLENILAHEPANPLARRGMAILKGQLNPAEIIDPNRQPPDPTPAAPQPVETKRFICRQCGGKMTFSPDGQSLDCAYCNRQLTLYHAIEEGAMVEEQDFAVALATARGHAHPVATQSFTCHGCGLSFILGPDVLSLTCPYCSSAHVIKVAETRDLIPPEGIIPFAVTQRQAGDILAKWLKTHGLRADARTTPPDGLYLPVWTFDVGGEAQWAGKTLDKRHGWTNWVPQHGAYPVLFDDLLVPASHALPKELIGEIRNFQLEGVLVYDPGYLADWPAEIYQISVADASLVARQQAWEQVRGTVRARAQSQQIRDLTVSSAGMVIESFKLILLPVWLTRYRYRDQAYQVVINGQTGNLSGERPRGGLHRWLANLLEGE